MDEQATDRYLGQLLSMERPIADEQFVTKTMRLVEAEETLRAAQRAQWFRFGIEVSIAAVVLIAFMLLGRLAGEPEGSTLAMGSPAAAAVMLLGVWFALTAGPSAQSAR